MIDLRGANYNSIYQLRRAFQSAGGRNDVINPRFNNTDTPTTLYFKLFFYFSNGGLLDLEHDDDDILQVGGITSNTYVFGGGDKIKDTAYNYLLLNNEFERAHILTDFIDILSDISTFSPWYFQKITGLSDALQRQELDSKEFKVPEERKSITIDCIPDAYDQRIGTLLDSYKAACFSHRLHKEIVPANLRKFDMAIYIFSTPIHGLHGSRDNMQTWNNWTKSNSEVGFMHPKSKSIDRKMDYASMFNDTRYTASSKLIEFKNCEFDLNSNTTGIDELDNAEGITPTYKIKINFDDVIEQRYNEFIANYIGDLVAWDVEYGETCEQVKESQQNAENNMHYLQDKAESRLNRINGVQEGGDYIILDHLVDNHQGVGGSTRASRLSERYGLDETEDDHQDVGGSIGSTRASQLLGKYGLDDAVDKVVNKANNLIDEYDPIRNGQRMLNNITSSASHALNNVISKITFGNLYHDKLIPSLKDLVDEAGHKVQDSLGINGKKAQQESLTSNVKNIYKGWTKSEKTAIKSKNLYH